MDINDYSTDERTEGKLDVTEVRMLEDQEVDNTVQTVSKGLETKHAESLDEALGEEEKDDKKEPEAKDDEKAETEDKDEKEDEGEEDEKPSRRRPSVEKRIQQLVQQRDHYKKLAEGKALEEAKKPEIKDFKDLDTYMEALAEYKASQVVNKVSTKEIEEEAKEEFAQLQASYDDKLTKYVKENKIDAEKFTEEVNKLPLNDGIIRAILGAENSPNVVDYLRHNPSVAKMISKLNPIDAAREIGRIDMKFEKKSTQVSKAPEPVKGIKKAAAPVEKDPSKMTQREYEEWRAKNTGKGKWG